jgi:hypothetical protein
MTKSFLKLIRWNINCRLHDSVIVSCRILTHRLPLYPLEARCGLRHSFLNVNGLKSRIHAQWSL